MAGLFSGGKDSTFAIFKTTLQKHDLCCILMMHPCSDDSLLFHYPTTNLLRKISSVIGVPAIEHSCNLSEKNYEINELTYLIKKAVDEFSIEGLINGCISSRFQLDIFQDICNKLRIKLVSPIWNIDSDYYYEQLLNHGFEIMITRVAALGLDSSWLGKIITKENISTLKKLSLKNKFNITFEGGEAETLVLDCPLYKKRIYVKDQRTTWDGVRGIFEILDVDLIEK
jgi:ABC transporter with metal-binding/Fe-S-binding domain ATP-binding protein